MNKNAFGYPGFASSRWSIGSLTAGDLPFITTPGLARSAGPAVHPASYRSATEKPSHRQGKRELFFLIFCHKSTQ